MEHDSSMFFTALGESALSRYQTHLSPPPLWLLVVHRDVTEQVGHGLSVVDAADCFSQYHADVHSLDFRTL